MNSSYRLHKLITNHFQFDPYLQGTSGIYPVRCSGGKGETPKSLSCHLYQRAYWSLAPLLYQNSQLKRSAAPLESH